MNRLTVILLASSLALAGCAEVVGTVTEKDHEAAETEKRPCTKYRTVNGKSKPYQATCTKRDDEDWEITVTDADGGTHELEVTRGEYDRLQVGDPYNSREN